MEPSRIIALVPCVTGPASSCLVIYEDWWESMSYCTVEKYMQTMASFMGNDNQACRKLFKGKRGTGLLFNDGSIFVQVKLSDKAPSLGYVRLSAIRSLYTDGEGKCIIGLSGGRELLTHWSLPTVERHIRLVRDVLSPRKYGQLHHFCDCHMFPLSNRSLAAHFPYNYFSAFLLLI